MTLIRGGFPGFGLLGCDSQKMRGQGLSVLMLESSWQQQEPALTCSGNWGLLWAAWHSSCRGYLGGLPTQNWAGHCWAVLHWGRQQSWPCWWPSEAPCCSVLSFSTCKAGMKSIMEALGTLMVFEALYQSYILRKGQLLMGVSDTFPDHTHCLSQNETSEMPSQNMLGHLEESVSFFPHTILILM